MYLLHSYKKRENTELESKYFYKINMCNMDKSRLSSLTEYINMYDVIDKTCLAASVFSFRACDWETVTAVSAVCCVT
jgi:hypothetical protein